MSHFAWVKNMGIKRLSLFLAGTALGLGGIAQSVSALSLTEAVQQALNTNPNVLEQSDEFMARQEEVGQAEAGYLPSVDLTAGIGREWSDNGTTRAAGLDHRTLTRKEAAIKLDQMLFDGFATRSEVARQNSRVDSQKYRLQGVGENTALSAVEVYSDILRHNALMGFSAANLKSHDKIYDQVKLRLNSGISASADLDQIIGRRASAAASLVSDKANLRDTESLFISVVGALPKDLEELPDVTSGFPTSLDTALSDAVANHPTLKSANADIEAAFAQQDAAKHNFYPKFNLEVGATYGNDLDGSIGRDRDMSAMVRMRYNLFSGGRDRARSRQTAHLVNESKEVRNSTYRQVVESMRLAWSAYETTLEQVAFYQEYVDASTRTRDAYVRQFRIGKRTLLDLLDTENEVFSAQRKRLDAKYDHLFAKYRVMLALGQLNQSLQVTQSEAATDVVRSQSAFVAIKHDSALTERIDALEEGLQRQ